MIQIERIESSKSVMRLVKIKLLQFGEGFCIYPQTIEVDEVVGEAGLNLLINNAGLLPGPRDYASTTPEFMRQAFEVNCIAPFFFTKASYFPG